MARGAATSRTERHYPIAALIKSEGTRIQALMEEPALPSRDAGDARDPQVRNRRLRHRTEATTCLTCSWLEALASIQRRSVTRHESSGSPRLTRFRSGWAPAAGVTTSDASVFKVLAIREPCRLHPRCQRPTHPSRIVLRPSSLSPPFSEQRALCLASCSTPTCPPAPASRTAHISPRVANDASPICCRTGSGSGSRRVGPIDWFTLAYARVRQLRGSPTDMRKVHFGDENRKLR